MTTASERFRKILHGPLVVAAQIATSPRDGWHTTYLADCAKYISTGTTPPSKEARYYGGEIDWLTPSDIGGVRWLTHATKTITDDAVVDRKARIFERNTVLITCIGQIGRLGITSRECSANQQITGIKFCDYIDPEFAYYLLLSRNNELEAAASSTTLPILNQSKLGIIEIHYPPLEEQRLISQFLSWYEDRLMGKSQISSNNWPKLPCYLSDLPRVVMLVEELAARIEEARELRRLAVEEADVLIPSFLGKLFGSLAKQFDVISLDRLSSHITDGPHKTPTYVSDGIPFITVKNMVSGKLNFNDFQYITIEDHLEFSKRCKPELGDVLYSKDGATRGHPCLVDTDREFNIFVSVALIKPIRDRLDGRYLCYVLKSTWIKERMAAKSRGDMIPHIVLKEIRNFPIPTPPIDDQRHIVAYLDKLQSKADTLKCLQNETAAELDALMPSILDRAFRGEL